MTEYDWGYEDNRTDEQKQTDEKFYKQKHRKIIVSCVSHEIFQCKFCKNIFDEKKDCVECCKNE